MNYISVLLLAILPQILHLETGDTVYLNQIGRAGGATRLRIGTHEGRCVPWVTL